MQKDGSHIAKPEAIKDGSYYKDARLWYSYRFLHPLVERSILFVSAIIVFLAIFISVINFYSLFPMKVRTPIVVGAKDLADYYTVMKPLAKKGEDPNAAIANYLASAYVARRESYNSNLLDVQQNFVKSNSSRQVFSSFMDGMNIQNPNSPLLRFQNHTKRTITINSVTLESNKSGLPQHATVYFTDIIAPANAIISSLVEDKNAAANQGVSSKWKAEIDFSMPNAMFAKETGLPFEFIVTEYTAKPIQ